MRKFIYQLLCVFLSLPGSAQTITIAGKIVDENAKPVPFASISILKNSLPVAAKFSSEDGSFKVAIDSVGHYTIKVTHASYSDFTGEKQISGPLSDETIVLGKKEKELAVATVTASKPFLTKKIDRVVMNVSNSPLTGGKSALELMNLAPGVFENDGDISINGNPGTRVMINGKLFQLTGDALKSYLSNLRAEDIESIEVIAHPPAQYDAEGTGGLLNIILKKNRKAGLTGTANASYFQGKYPGTSDGMSLSYNKNKLTLFGSYSYTRAESYENSSLIREADFAELSTAYSKINHGEGSLVRGGGTYDIDKNQFIGVEYNGSFRQTSFSLNSIANINYPSPSDNQTSIGQFPFSTNSDYNNVSLNYHLSVNSKGSEFVILSDYTQNKITSVSGAQSTLYDYNHTFLSDTSYGNQRPSGAKIFTATANYKNVFSKATILNFGAKISNTNIDNTASNQYVENGKELEATWQNFKYVYNENILAGYLSFNTTVLKTDVQLGFRGEYTNLTGTLTQINNNQRNPSHYFNLFPTVFLKKNLNQSASDYLTFNFSRRVQRPPFSSLNPYQFYVDNYTIAKGNPYLVPSFTNSFELAYTLNNKYTVSVFLDKQKDMIGEYLMTSPDTLLSIDMPENFGSRTNYGLTFSIPIKVARWWQMQNNIIVRHESLATDGYTITATPVELKTTQEFLLPDAFTLSANAFYYSRNIAGNFLFRNMAQVDIGLQKKLMRNKLTLKATANDVLGLRKIDAIVYYSTGQMSFHSDRQWQTVNLTAIYNFDLGKAFSPHKLENSNTEEKNRL